MSWSVQAVGRPAAVRKSIAEQFAKGGKCLEPEETIRQAAASMIDKSLESQSETMAVKVSASGSQSQVDWNDVSKGTNNQLTISVEPIYGFVE